MADDIRQMIYISDARYGLKKKDIEDILAASRRNNGESDVTGMLLYSSGIFIQALEGDPQRVAALYDRISDDRRHGDIDLVSDRMVDRRSFSGWAMGFVERAPEELGRELGVNGVMDRSQAIAALSASESRAGDMLRRFADNAY